MSHSSHVAEKYHQFIAHASVLKRLLKVTDCERRGRIHDAIDTFGISRHFEVGYIALCRLRVHSRLLRLARDWWRQTSDSKGSDRKASHLGCKTTVSCLLFVAPPVSSELPVRPEG